MRLILLLRFVHKSWLCMFPKPTLFFVFVLNMSVFQENRKPRLWFCAAAQYWGTGRTPLYLSEYFFLQKRKWTLLQYVALSGKVICSNSGRSSFNALIAMIFDFLILQWYRRYIIPLQKKLPEILFYIWPEILVSFVRLADVLPNLDNYYIIWSMTNICIFT